MNTGAASEWLTVPVAQSWERETVLTLWECTVPVPERAPQRENHFRNDCAIVLYVQYIFFLPRAFIGGIKEVWNQG